jgi:two-component system response regulator FixJ
VSCYRNASEFLAEVRQDVVGCLITELQVPGSLGSYLQRQVAATHPSLAVIVVTGSADVATAVQVMQSGAITLLEKPYVPHLLLAAVKKAIEQSQLKAHGLRTEAAIRMRLGLLSDDERQVMRLMIQGFPNKRIVMDLQLSPRTVDRRRAAVLAKMEVTSVPELAALMSRFPDW